MRRLTLFLTTLCEICFLTSGQASDLTPQKPRDSLQISGVYPHLTTYGVYSENGAHHKRGHEECGIGAVVPWADRLWMVNYAPHMPEGSEHKLFSIDSTLELTIHPESVGGTPAGRMIHQESNQLLIGHHLIDSAGQVRTIAPKIMPIRVTAIARHLSDPANFVYYVDMEGSVWEANVHTLAVKQLFAKPVPGAHGKGGYSGQGRLIVSNNGGQSPPRDSEASNRGKQRHHEDIGVLAEWDGKDWRIIERRQFTDITGPSGVAGGGNENDPVWAIGWDKRSLRLKVLDHGKWHTYLLPKASFCNDAPHGWYTEWPRIREITGGRWMMDMHGMFFDFPKAFSASRSGGIAPIASHLRYIPDFCQWNGQLVLATDETSIQGNRLAGQPQSNLWFGTYEDLKTWGPASAYGGPWIDDEVSADTPSDPFLVAGFDRRVLHLSVSTSESSSPTSQGSPQTRGQRAPEKVLVTLQVDQQGDGGWADEATIEIGEGGYTCHVFPKDFQGTWLRLKTDRNCRATAVLHQTAAPDQNRSQLSAESLFARLADVHDPNAVEALIYPEKSTRNLRVLTDGNREFEFTKAGFEFETAESQPGLSELLRVEPEFSVDEASVVVHSDGRIFRLPKGAAAFDMAFKSGWPRSSREVESERHLANIHGTFYEIPLLRNGEPPQFSLMRPVASHSKRITDFCSWNGLLVLAGVRRDAGADGHVFNNPQKEVGLWFGGIDDLWKLGKPVGRGGPWKETAVKAGAPSDAYLMTGYDRKSLVLSTDQAATVTIEVDVDHQSGWHVFKTVDLPASRHWEYEFPESFSAHWVRFTCDRDCTATALLKYD